MGTTVRIAYRADGDSQITPRTPGFLDMRIGEPLLVGNHGDTGSWTYLHTGETP